jgi:hypothetical protein
MNPVEEDRALDEEANAYFGREQRGREAMDPATRQLAFIAGGIGLLLAVLIGGWLLSGHRSGTIPIIEAAAGPVRIKPVDPGGMQAMGAQAPPVVSSAGVETLAPRPEAARPDALQAEVDAARRAGDGGRKPPAAMPSPAGPAPAAPAAGAPAAPSSSSVGSGAGAAPQAVPHAPADAGSGPLLRTESEPRRNGGEAPHGGALAVQLAAVNSDQAAQMEWSRLCRSHPALFSGRKPDVEQVDRNGKRIYRLRTRGFASTVEANSFCEQARAQKVACTVAAF